MVKLLCGPIVGQVTSTTAKVLLEVDEDVPAMVCILQEDMPKAIKGHTSEFRSKKDMIAKRPLVFTFENLRPSISYRIVVPTVAQRSIGLVKTIPEDVKNLNVAVASCDKRNFTSNKNMWEVMWERMKSKKDDIHVLLHIGDNVYIDGDVSHNKTNECVVANDEGVFDEDKTDQTIPYVQARTILRDTPKEQWDEKKDEILEVYREEYRKTFGRKYVALVLAHVSNIMILDDHDIRDDFGSVPEDSDPESTEFFLGHLALQVFHEYQRALWDPEVLTRGHSDLTSEFISMTLGPVGVMMLDARTVWSLYKSKRADNDLSYFGEDQINRVKKCLNDDNGVVLWAMVCPLPLLFLKKKLNELLMSACDRADDLMGFMNMRHQRDLEGMFNLIQTWRTAKPGRELLVFSGDVHIAGFTDIYHIPPGGKKSLVCRQITSSAINNERPGDVGMACVRFCLGRNETYGDFTYQHYDWINRCNYAVLQIERFKPTLDYKVKLVHEEGIIVKKSIEKDWGANATQSCMCDIL